MTSARPQWFNLWGLLSPLSFSVQVLYRPSGTVLRVFVVPFDLSRLECGKTTFIRQRTVSAVLSSSRKQLLHYAIHFRWVLMWLLPILKFCSITSTKCDSCRGLCVMSLVVVNTHWHSSLCFDFTYLLQSSTVWSWSSSAAEGCQGSVFTLATRCIWCIRLAKRTDHRDFGTAPADPDQDRARTSNRVARSISAAQVSPEWRGEWVASFKTLAGSQSMLWQSESSALWKATLYINSATTFWWDNQVEEEKGICSHIRSTF